MSGLSLRAGAQVRSGGQAVYGTVADPQTSGVAAYGLAGAPAGTGGKGLSPTHPAGVIFWAGLAAFGALVFVYWSLPE